MIDENKLESIFATVLPLSDDERTSYLDNECGGNTELRQRVNALLRASVDAGSFLDKPPAEFIPTIAAGEFDTVDEGRIEISLDFLQESDKPGCIGTLGPYEVVEVVGRGGMGLVLRAHDPKLNRVVAIKVMAPELAANPTAVKRFLREAQAAAAVSHDHVVTIHAIDEDNKPPFIVMECVDGLSLQEKIDNEGTLELKEILRIGTQTAAGLAAAHKQGLVHRDIKPANILLENGIERVKITDFGLARAVDDVSITQTGQIAGTPQYMSPEQAQGQAIDVRSDLFSFGSVLYTMCTGRPPFRAETAVAMLRRVTDDDARSIRVVNAEIPDWLEAIIFKLLAKDPAERFQSAEEVAELLGQHLAHLQHPTTTPLPQPVEVNSSVGWASKPVQDLAMDGFGKPSYRRRWPIAVGTAIALMFLVAVAGVVIYIQTDYGTVRILVEDPDAKVVLRCDDGHRRIDIEDYDITIGLRSGDNTLHIKHGDLEFETDKFAVKRGDKVVVRVSRVEGKLEVRAGDVVIGRKGLPIQAATPSRSEITELLRDAILVMNFENETFSGSDRFSVRDLSGNGNDGTCLENTTWRPDGKNGGALALEGAGLKFERPLIPGSESFTFAGWFKLGKPTGPAGLNRWHVYDERLDSRWSDLNLTIQNGGLELGYRYPETAKRAKLGRSQAMALHTFPGRGPWFFAAWTYDAHNHFTYTINELSVSSADLDLTQREQGTKRDAVIGRDFNGMMDDVVVFNRALSKDELKKLYSYGLAGHSLPTGKIDSNPITEVLRFEGQRGFVVSLDFAPNGWQLVSGCGAWASGRKVPAKVMLWDARNGRRQREFQGHKASPLRARFSPDGRYVASGDKSGLIILLDGKTLEEVRRFEGHTGEIRCLGFSPDNRLLASGSSNWNNSGADVSVRVWDVETGKEIWRRDLPQIRGGGEVTGVAFSPDSKKLASTHHSGDEPVTIWNSETGEPIRRIKRLGSPVKSCAWSPNGRYLATGHAAVTVDRNQWHDPQHCVIRLYDAETCRELRQFQGHTATIDSIDFSPDSRLLVSGSGAQDLNKREKGSHDNSIRIWDVESGRELIEEQLQKPLKCVRFSPDGKRIATVAGLIREKPDLQLWRLPESVWPRAEEAVSEVRRVEGHTDMIDAVVYTPDGKRIVTGGFDETIRVWDAASGKLLDTIHTPHAVLSLAVSPDGKTVVSGMFGTQVVLWDLKTKRDVQHFIGHERGNWRGKPAGKILAVAFSPDGTQLASGGEGPKLRVWDVASGKQVAEFPLNGTPLQSIAWTSDGKRIVCGEYNGTMTWCNVETEKIDRRTDGEAYGKWLALSPDDRRVVGGDNIYDAETFALVKKLDVDGVYFIGAQFTRDGRFVIAPSATGLVRVWDAVTGKELARFEDATGQANKLAISPDSRSVAFGGGGSWNDEKNKMIKTGDNALRVWRLPASVSSSIRNSKE